MLVIVAVLDNEQTAAPPAFSGSIATTNYPNICLLKIESSTSVLY